ncbi:MAG: hypothetical protein AAF569_07165 [Pseudomonadota bacterium]
MSVQCSIKGTNASVGKLPKSLQSKRLKKWLLVFTTVFVLSTLLVSQAGAIETTRASAFDPTFKNRGTTSLQSSPSMDMADKCLPLLNKVRHTSSLSAMDPNRRPAGHKAATVGFVIGLRIALGPTEVTGSNRVSMGPQVLHSRNSGSSHALAVADYRACKNKAALNALNKTTNWNR